jgi:hypothetical protein
MNTARGRFKINISGLYFIFLLSIFRVAWCSSTGVDLQSSILFRGAYGSGGKVYVTIATQDGSSLGWFKIGDSVQGYRLAEISEDYNTLVLEKNGIKLSLRMNVSVIRPLFVEKDDGSSHKIMNRHDGLELVKRIFSSENYIPKPDSSSQSVTITLKDSNGKPTPVTPEKMKLVNDYMEKQGMVLQDDGKGDKFYIAPLARDTLPKEISGGFSGADWDQAQKIYLDYIKSIREKQK